MHINGVFMNWKENSIKNTPIKFGGIDILAVMMSNWKPSWISSEIF